jgi:hypothetical protein
MVIASISRFDYSTLKPSGVPEKKARFTFEILEAGKWKGDI